MEHNGATHQAAARLELTIQQIRQVRAVISREAVDVMRLHVPEHGRVRHTHCMKCYFCERIQTRCRIIRTAQRRADINDDGAIAAALRTNLQGSVAQETTSRKAAVAEAIEMERDDLVLSHHERRVLITLAPLQGLWIPMDDMVTNRWRRRRDAK